MADQQFDLENHDYMWFRIFNGENVPTIPRRRLDYIAKKYELDPSKFKNKKLLIKKLMVLWEDYFAENLQFKSEYEMKYLGFIVPDILPPMSEWI
jgi:hypothetical protein